MLLITPVHGSKKGPHFLGCRVLDRFTLSVHEPVVAHPILRRGGAPELSYMSATDMVIRPNVVSGRSPIRDIDWGSVSRPCRVKNPTNPRTPAFCPVFPRSPPLWDRGKCSWPVSMSAMGRKLPPKLVRFRPNAQIFTAIPMKPARTCEKYR